MEYKYFKDINLTDPFFDSLRADYEGFDDWFRKKSEDKALVDYDDNILSGFLYLKPENESVENILPCSNRLKIGTFKTAKNIQGTRKGEGMLAHALWRANNDNLQEIYLTIFPKQLKLIEMIKSFGFKDKGTLNNGEHLFLKDVNDDFETIREYFPKAKWNGTANLLAISEKYHDKLFPKATLKNTIQNTGDLAVKNGISKVYIAYRSGLGDTYIKNNFVFLYRMYEIKKDVQDNQKKAFKSVITSYGVIEECIDVSINGKKQMSLEDFKTEVGNKSVFSEDELNSFYKRYNLSIIKFVYLDSFGEGNNVNCNWLKQNKIWGNSHPYGIKWDRMATEAVLKEGKKNVYNIITD